MRIPDRGEMKEKMSGLAGRRRVNHPENLSIGDSPSGTIGHLSSVWKTGDNFGQQLAETTGNWQWRMVAPWEIDRRSKQLASEIWRDAG
jgi:hypothetical protein